MEKIQFNDELCILAELAACARTPKELFATTLPTVLSMTDARAVYVMRRLAGEEILSGHDRFVLRENGGWGVTAFIGLELETDDAGLSDALFTDTSGQGRQLRELPIPMRWATKGIVTAAIRSLPGHTGGVLLAWSVEPPASTRVQATLSIVDASLARIEAEAVLSDLTLRVDRAQQMANIGDYVYHRSGISEWSDQMYRIYGYEPQSFQPSVDFVRAALHPDDYERVEALHAKAFETGQPTEITQRIMRADGEVRHLLVKVQFVHGAVGEVDRSCGTCLDITDRVLAEQEREAMVASLREAQVRRRQALEINDNVVQGLTAAVISMMQGKLTASTSYLERTLSSARQLMDDWLEPLNGEGLEPGDLVRAEPSTLRREESPVVELRMPLDIPKRQPAPTPTAPRARVLIADDNQDVRLTLRDLLDSYGKYEVAGEAVDGEEAVRLASELQPDVVLLDLSMPRMDGLEALPLIRQAVDGVQVLMLSGFATASVAKAVLDAGAARYVEKGVRMDLDKVIQEVLVANADA
jgi:PAS domain S-box-containing protein